MFCALLGQDQVSVYRTIGPLVFKSFKHFQNHIGTNSATMLVKNSGWSMSNFQDLPKKTKSNVDTAKRFVLL